MDVDVEGEGQSAGLKGLLEEDDQALSLSAFETLEKEFQDVLATLAGDESLDEFLDHNVKLLYHLCSCSEDCLLLYSPSPFNPSSFSDSFLCGLKIEVRFVGSQEQGLL